MNNKIEIVSTKEKNKANLFLIFSILSQFLEILFGFLIVKLTISFYGEPINGVIRFLTQIFTYIMLMVSSLWTVFEIKSIQYYKSGNWEYLFWLSTYIKKKLKIFSLIYLVIFLSISPLIAFTLSGNDINMFFVFCLFLSLSIRPYFSLSVYGKYAIFYSSINKGYVPVIISSAIKSLLFSYLLLILVLLRPKLITITDQSTGTEILTFIKGSKKIYSFIIGIGVYALTPLFAGIILSIKYKYDYKNNHLFNTKNIINTSAKLKIKKDIWRNVKFSLILGVSALIVSNTDEFVILMLKDGSNYDYILKIIGIYGIYISILISIKSIILQYTNTRIILIGLAIEEKNKNVKIFKEIKTNSYILGMIFLAISIIIVPFIVNFLFNPTDNLQPYFNTKFSLPIGILFTLSIFYQPTYILLQVDNQFKMLSLLSLIEGIINIILSASLIKILGIYWIVWASIIACTTKLLLFEYLALFKYKKYPSHFNFQYKKTIYILFALLVAIVQIVLINTVSLLALDHAITQITPFSVFLIEAILAIFIWCFTIYRNKFKLLK